MTCMAVFDILTFGNPALKERARLVDVDREDIKKLALDLADTMYEGSGIGLAATQCGIMKRVVVCDVDDGLLVLVNPEVEPACEDVEGDEEGCLSVPDVKILIERPSKISVRAFHENGQRCEFEAEGLLARVIQHEVDHLDGLLILDRASKAERRRAMQQQKEAAEERASGVGPPPMVPRQVRPPKDRPDAPKL
jgi:peptide deformylase